jgi:hypothetical protein
MRWASWSYRLSVLIKTPVGPCELVADFEPGILDGAGKPVIRARAGECDQVPAGLQDAKNLRPELGGKCRLARIPILAHKSACRPRIRVGPLSWDGALETFRLVTGSHARPPLIDGYERIGRIADDAIDARLGQRLQHLP